MTQKIVLKSLYVAVGKSMIGRYAVYAIQFISILILARLFSPKQFGIVASVQVFFVFFQLIAEIGIGPALINLKSLLHRDRNGIFSFTLLVGVGLALIFALLAPSFETFYRIDRISEVVPYVAASIFFSASAIVPTASLQRDQHFFRLAHAGLIAELGSVMSVIVLFHYINPLHALASKALISSALRFMSCYWFSRKTEFGMAVPGKNILAIKPILSFSLYQFGFNFINYFSRNLDNILVARQMGAGMLGVYDKAYQLMRYPLMLLTFAMTPAIQPVISKHVGDKLMVEAVHRDFTFKLAILGLLAGAVIAFLSDFIVMLFLGPQWKSVAPIIHVLAYSIPVQVVLSTSGSFFQAMNRADLLFLSGILSAIVMVTAIIYGVYRADLIILSWSLVIAFHINFIQAYYIMYSKVFKMNVALFLKKMFLPISGVILMISSSTIDFNWVWLADFIKTLVASN